MNKKHGSNKKTWKIDCRVDSSFTFAMDYIYKEALNPGWSVEMRLNFLNIALNNMIETINRCQTDPEEYKLPVAVKIFTTGLKKIVATANILLTDFSLIPRVSEEVYKHDFRAGMNNAYDYYEIDYSSLEKDVKGFPNASSKRPEEMYTRYNYPKIYIISERAMSDCKVELLPTNDVKITINLMAYLAIRCGGSWAKDEYNFRMPQAFTITEMTPQQNAIEDFIVHPGGNLNMLLQTPYDDFWGIIKSLQKTLDISTSKAQRVRVTGYRLGSDNPILDFVISMLNRNVPCDVYVELDARGEIENSIRELYNMVSSASLVEQKTGLEKLNLRLHYNDVKVHGKMICIDLVDGRSIVIFGTGNFNPQTTNVYKDYFYITSDPKVVDTINHNFDMIFNNTQPVLSSIAQLVLSEIYKEIAKGKDGKIYIQTNHLDNKLIVTALKEAIRRKCDVKLIVRTTKGFHKKDLPVVKTVVGKYLEHSRVYMFGKDSELRAYLSSSDLLYRNLYNRFESYIKVDKRTGMYLLINFLALYKEGQRYITGSGSTEVMPKPKPINMKKEKEKEKD